MLALPLDAHEPGSPRLTGITCPECPGVLEVESAGGDTLVFRCRIGHLYTQEELLMGKEQRVERLLWAAVEALEELSALLREIGVDGERGSRAHREAEAVRRVIEDMVPVRVEEGAPRWAGEGGAP